jgi:hypothetical protein
MRVIYILIVIWIIAQIPICKWMFRAKPDKNITQKYPKKVIFQSQLPFGSSWKKKIDKSDILVMERYQQRIKWWYLSLIIPFALFLTFA